MKTKIKQNQEITFESYLNRVANKEFEKRKRDRYAYNEGRIEDFFNNIKKSFKPGNLREGIIRVNLARKSAGKLKIFFKQKVGEIKQNIKKGGLWVFEKVIVPILERVKDSFIYKIIKQLFNKIKIFLEKFSNPKKQLTPDYSSKEYESNNDEIFYNENFNLPFSKPNPGNVIKIIYRVKGHKITINSITGEALIEGKDPSSIWEEIFPGKGIKNSYKWKKNEWMIIRKYIEGSDGKSEVGDSTKGDSDSKNKTSSFASNAKKSEDNELKTGDSIEDDSDSIEDDSDSIIKTKSSLLNAKKNEDSEPIPLDKLEGDIDLKRAEEEEEKNPKSPVTLYQKIMIGLGILILLTLLIGFTIVIGNQNQILANQEEMKGLLLTLNSNLMTVQHNMLTGLSKLAKAFNISNTQWGKSLAALKNKLEDIQTVQGLQSVQAEENAKGTLEWVFDKMMPDKGVAIPTSDPKLENYVVIPKSAPKLTQEILSVKESAKGGVDMSAIIAKALANGWIKLK